MQLADKIVAMREDAIARGEAPVADMLQGVTKVRIAEVLRALDLETADRVDAVFSLLDNKRRSWFTTLPDDVMFSDGASIAHVGCHVGILQRGKSKLDREGRDYWIKPLREIGAIEPIYLDSDSKTFVPGHPKAKSPNSAYRLDAAFAEVLRAPETEWRSKLVAWSSEDAKRERLRFRADQAEATRAATDTAHADLIRACCEVYAPKFLPEYEVLFVDDSDGDRVSEGEREALYGTGLDLSLGDAMPDVLLYHRGRDAIWIIEAVTSDGEVDQHKVDRVHDFAKRHGKSTVGFTTAYPTWKVAAQRQGRHKNIAPGTYIWIREDPAKQFHAESFDF
ncbi:MAG: BsuBI/PstI family type II restriction endonuclease [Planctomycetota bacterium]